MAWYALGWGLFLTSGLVGLAGRAAYLWPVLWVVFGLVQLELGYRLGRSAPAGLPAPGRPGARLRASTPAAAPDDVVAALLLFPVMPVGAAFSGNGIWLRSRSWAISPGDVVDVDAERYEGYATARGVSDGELVFTPLVTIWDPASVAFSRVSWHGAHPSRRSKERT
jgi:hypothetical protein